MLFRSYDKENQLLTTQFSGNIELDKILIYIHAVAINTEYARDLNLLIDARNTNSMYSVNGVKSISEASKQAFRNYTSARIALIENNPIETALSSLYQKITRPKNYKIKIFSTKKAALKWLMGK